ncbi:hypothetical protein [Absiella sp. AM29-15]|uniref:hypothetical protein n=1 Tax=Absiella sp. AM29-15 TaxID=2292278 RepID=UPI000E42C6B3|nr:hypothetical protein [Absiella sp. AM29-15]RGC46919.1 hypothetical protein DW761_16740 [Absiella sp. AM29-15]
MEEYQVPIMQLDHQAVEYLTLYVDDENDDIIMYLHYLNQTYKATGSSYFSAYQSLRDQLLEDGYGLKCNGSYINAIQSAMMSFVDKVYLVTSGKQALQKDIVNLFDEADIHDFPDTEKQQAFANLWFASLT